MDVDDHRSHLLLKVSSSIAYLSTKHSSLLGNVRVHAAAATVQILYAGFQVLASAALSSGTSRSVFPVYRNAIAAVLIAPLAFFMERRTRPGLTFFKLSQFFLCGLIGICINQTLFLAGLYYTSATFAATVQNLTPALTFAIAAALGIERIRIKRREGQAKALGVLIGVGGAMLIALYKGPSIVTVPGSFFQSYTVVQNQLTLETSSFVSWQLGVFCLFGNCATWAIWFILQNPVLRDYPAQLSATAFTYTFGSIQLALIAMCVERDLDTWAATFYSDLPAILYGGLVASGVAMTLQGWCAYQGGPVLVAAYQPLQTILVAILSSIFLQETFYLGSLIGGFFIIIGLYLVVWGKSRERSLGILAESIKDFPTYQPALISSTEAEERLSEPLLDGGSTFRSSNEL